MFQAVKSENCVTHIDMLAIQIKIEPRHLTGDVEDEESVKCHLESLMVEMGKVHPNQKKVAELIQLTYPYRRKDIQQAMHVVDILKKYPFLEDVDEVRGNCNSFITFICIRMHGKYWYTILINRSKHRQFMTEVACIFGSKVQEHNPFPNVAQKLLAYARETNCTAAVKHVLKMWNTELKGEIHLNRSIHIIYTYTYIYMYIYLYVSVIAQRRGQ